MSDAGFSLFGPNPPPMLGRQSVINRITQNFAKATPSNLSLVGPRYSGKSVVLAAISESISESGSAFGAVVLWDLGNQTPDSDQAFLYTFRDKLADALEESGYSEHSKDVRSVDDGNYADLREVVEYLGGLGIRVLVLWDGFDRPLASGLLTRNLWDQLRELAQLPTLTYVTASRRPLSELIRSQEAATSEFWNTFDSSPVRIGVFDDSDQEAILSQIADLDFEGSARAEILNWTAGYPPLFICLVNQIREEYERGKVDNTAVNDVAECESEQIRSIVESLWMDCPTESQDLFRDLLKNDSIPRNSVSRTDEGWLLERGFAATKRNALVRSCRFLERYLEGDQHRSGMVHLFGEWESYRWSMREVLERRLNQLNHLDPGLKHLTAQAISDIPEFPDYCLNNLSHIEDQVLDLIWNQEFGERKLVSRELVDEWNQIDSNNSVVRELNGTASFAVPNDRGRQLGLLRLLTGCQQRFASRARYATKDTYVLVDAMHSFRNRTQHADGEPMHAGVAISGLMICLELLAWLERRSEGQPF